MRKLNMCIVLILSFCLVQELRAVAPGGALGGNTKGTAAQGSENRNDRATGQASSPEAAAMDNFNGMAPGEKHTGKKVGKNARVGFPEFDEIRREFENSSSALRSEKEKIRLIEEYAAAYRQAKLAAHEGDLTAYSGNAWWLLLFAFLIPPATVGIRERGITSDLYMNVILTLLFFIPGVIHAFVVVSK